MSSTYTAKLILFTRYPVPGKAKTRLIPVLGETGAAFLHKKLTEKIFNIVMEASGRKNFLAEVAFEGTSKDRMTKWLGPGPEYRLQMAGDLGKRMHEAFRRAFAEGYEKVVLIGSDIPDIKPEHLARAFDILVKSDIVFGPSNDGGYWMVGMKRPVNIFCLEKWGEKDVLQQTLKMVKEKRMSFSLLEPLNDIDEPEDLIHLRGDFEANNPYLSVIIPTLNEEKNIKETIEKAVHDEVEIIIVDGGSRDNTVSIASESGTKVVSSPKGRAVQLNNGARIARGHILLFLHADTVLPVDYVKIIFNALITYGTVAGAFRFKTDMDGLVMNIIERIVNIRARKFGIPYGDQGLFLEKKRFYTLGGFPEVPIAEDLYFVRKLSGEGHLNIVDENIVTSARRWRKKGMFKTTIINYIILAGCILGLPPEKLARLY